MRTFQDSAQHSGRDLARSLRHRSARSTVDARNAGDSAVRGRVPLVQLSVSVLHQELYRRRTACQVRNNYGSAQRLHSSHHTGRADGWVYRNTASRPRSGHAGYESVCWIGGDDLGNALPSSRFQCPNTYTCVRKRYMHGWSQRLGLLCEPGVVDGLCKRARAGPGHLWTSPGPMHERPWPAPFGVPCLFSCRTHANSRA